LGSLKLCADLLEAIEIAELQRGELEAVHRAADGKVVAGAAGDLERALAQLDRLGELQLVGEHQRKAVKRTDLSGVVAQFLGDPQRLFVTASGDLGVEHVPMGP